MNYLIFITFFVLVLFFIFTRNKPENIINWKLLYNEKNRNNVIKQEIQEYINKITVQEEVTCINDYDIYYNQNYSNFSNVELLDHLKTKFTEQVLVLFFVEMDLKLENNKYKIDKYNQKLELIKNIILFKTEYKNLNYYQTILKLRN